MAKSDLITGQWAGMIHLKLRQAVPVAWPNLASAGDELYVFNLDDRVVISVRSTAEHVKKYQISATKELLWEC